MTTREIQLTAKQLVFVFMSTLLAAVVVFLLGVWVGRGIGVEPAVAGQELAGAGADAGTVASAKGAPSDTGKLSYPDLLQGGSKSVGSPPAGRPQGEASAPPPATPPATEPKPAAPPPAPPERSKPTPPAQQAPPAAGEGYFVQTAAYSSKASADREAASLKAMGYAAFVTSGPLFRVRMGPFSERAAAEKVATRLRGESKGFKPSVIPSR
jgi:cell division septation protein DedD